MRRRARNMLRLAVMVGTVAALAWWLAPEAPASAPYDSPLSDPSLEPVAIRRCPQQICVENTDGTWRCEKQNSSIFKCKLGSGRGSCTEIGC